MATLLPRWCLNPSDGLRRWQATNGVTTTYVLDLQPELATVLQASDPSGATSYLYGLGDSPLVGDDGATWRYLSGRDALGSVRQETDAAGQVLAVRRHDPYGVPLTPDGGTPYGYSGEWWDAATELVYLRARYLRPDLGVFTSRDPWPGDVRQPGTLNGYGYVGGNPLRYTDPTGMLRWGFPSGTAPHHHFFIENYFQIYPLNLDRHLEFRLPSGLKIDMFDSRSGEVFEIEPVSNVEDGVDQVRNYVTELGKLKDQLIVDYLGIIRLNWTETNWRVGTRLGWGGSRFEKMLPTVLGYSYVKLVADYLRDGVVVYWLEPAISVPLLPMFKPVVRTENEKRLLRPQGWQPGQFLPQPQPAYSAAEVCETALGVLSAALVAATLAEDVATGGLGVLDDAPTLAVAKALTDLGRSLRTPAVTYP